MHIRIDFVTDGVISYFSVSWQALITYKLTHILKGVCKNCNLRNFVSLPLIWSMNSIFKYLKLQEKQNLCRESFQPSSHIGTFLGTWLLGSLPL